MKKILLSVLMALISCSLFADVEEVENKNVTRVGDGQSYTFYKAYSHWSIAVSGGFNLLVADLLPPKYSYIDWLTNSTLGEFNAEVEYSINPIWGVAVDYAYAPIAKGAIYKSAKTCRVNPIRNAQGHQAYAMVNVNLLNLFRRYRGHTEWSWYLGAGAGVFLYNASSYLYYPEDEVKDKEKFKGVPMIPVETRVEFTPIPSIGIFLKGGLDFYLSDRINIYQGGALTDWNVYGGLGLRWNIGATKKPSARTIDMNTYETVPRRASSVDDETSMRQNAPQKNPLTEEQLAQLQKQIDQLELRVANMEYAAGNASGNTSSTSNPSSDNLNDIILAVDRKADKNAADIRDMKIDINNVRELAMRSNSTDENTIYFDNNSSRISKEYMLVLARIAKMMMLDPSLHLDVSSYCSNVGDVEQNKKLGEQRIDAVRYVLINRYRIDENRIHAHYNGQVDDVFDDMNRRCDLTFK